MFRFTKKLRRIKSELKIWSRSKFANFSKQVEKNSAKLQFVESMIIANPQNHRLNDWHFRLLKQRERLLMFNKRYWGTLARKNWLVDGDRNSRFFHQSATARKRHCSILRSRIRPAYGLRILKKLGRNLFKIISIVLLPLVAPLPSHQVIRQILL